MELKSLRSIRVENLEGVDSKTIYFSMDSLLEDLNSKQIDLGTVLSQRGYELHFNGNRRSVARTFGGTQPVGLIIVTETSQDAQEYINDPEQFVNDIKQQVSSRKKNGTSVESSGLFEKWKNKLLFLSHPGNYVLLTISAMFFATLIGAGLIAGSLVGAVATATVGALLAVVALPIFVIMKAIEDKAQMAAKLAAENANPERRTSAAWTQDASGSVLITADNYKWVDYFLGHVGINDKRTHGLLTRLFQLAAQHPVRRIIAAVGIVLAVAALIFGLGYFLAPAFVFMAPLFGALTGALSGGFAAMAAGGLGFMGAISPAAIAAIAVILFVALPLCLVDSINRMITFFADEGDLGIVSSFHSLRSNPLNTFGTYMAMKWQEFQVWIAEKFQRSPGESEMEDITKGPEKPHKDYREIPGYKPSGGRTDSEPSTNIFTRAGEALFSFWHRITDSSEGSVVHVEPHTGSRPQAPQGGYTG